ncbi:MAG: putative lipid II flippase FtsW [Planctomycetes bacterium]|nr:putative lipid II flippase FtsW [Planctomycetota bacterium]
MIRTRPQTTARGLTFVVGVLVALGVILIYSSSSVLMLNKAQDPTRFLRKQLLFVVLAGSSFALARHTRLTTLRRHAWSLLGVTALLLVAVLIPGIGRRVNGASRWIPLGGFNMQPSELAKLGLPLFLAAYCSGRREALGTLKGALPALGAIAGVVGLIAIEPDMGTAMLVGCVSVAILLAAGVKLRHLLLCAVPGLMGLFVFALTKLDYIWRRIHAFMDPAGNDVAYQTNQSVIAIGSGGLFGVGLGASEQKRAFLPELHTDFIFALVGEELGFCGGLFVIGCFAALIVLGMRAVERAHDQFSMLLGQGILLVLGIQSLLNLAVATQSIPPKGIALPFLSYGGSSLISCAAAMGILVRIAAQGRPEAPGAEPAASEAPDSAPAPALA